MFIEQLNKVELVGTVGSVAVNRVGDKKNVRLLVQQFEMDRSIASGKTSD